MHLFCPPIGCNPVLDGTASAQNGLETDGGNEEYTLMSIDTIINGKVIIVLHWMAFESSATLAVWPNGWECRPIGLFALRLCTDFHVPQWTNPTG